MFAIPVLGTISLKNLHLLFSFSCLLPCSSQDRKLFADSSLTQKARRMRKIWKSVSKTALTHVTIVVTHHHHPQFSHVLGGGVLVQWLRPSFAGNGGPSFSKYVWGDFWRQAWHAAVHVAKSRTQLSNWTELTEDKPLPWSDPRHFFECSGCALHKCAHCTGSHSKFHVLSVEASWKTPFGSNHWLQKESQERIILRLHLPFLVSKVLIFWYTIKALYLLHLLFVTYLFLWNVNFQRVGIFVFSTDKSHMPVKVLTYSWLSKTICWIKWKLKLGHNSKFPSLISEPFDFQRFSWLWVRPICASLLVFSLEVALLPPANYHDTDPLFAHSSS